MLDFTSCMLGLPPSLLGFSHILGCTVIYYLPRLFQQLFLCPPLLSPTHHLSGSGRLSFFYLTSLLNLQSQLTRARTIPVSPHQSEAGQVSSQRTGIGPLPLSTHPQLKTTRFPRIPVLLAW